MTTMSRPTFLTVRQIADELQVTPQTVRAWLTSGRLPGALISNSIGWRIATTDLDAFIVRHLHVKEAAIE